MHDMELTKWTRDGGLDVGLHGAKCITELEDAGADRVLIESGGASRGRNRGLGNDRWLLRWSINLGLFRSSRCPQLELQLGLGSTDESLEDGRVGVVEDDIAAGRVGIALEDDSLVGGDAENLTELCKCQPRCTDSCDDKLIHTLIGSVFAPRSLRGNLSLLVESSNATLMVMSVSSFTGPVDEGISNEAWA